MLYENYVEDIQHKLRTQPNMEFLKTYQTKSEIFRHSGLSIKSGLIPKQVNTNSIIEPPKKIGFGNPTTILESQPKTKTLYQSSSTPAIKNVHLMDPRKAAALYVRQACIEYSSIVKPTQSEKTLQRVPSQDIMIEDEDLREEKYTDDMKIPKKGSPSTSFLKNEKTEGDTLQKNTNKPKYASIQSRPHSSMTGARPSTAASHGVLVRKVNSKTQYHLKGDLALSKPNSAATRTTAAPSAYEHETTQEDLAEKKARILKARKGVEQFDFLLPEENMVEIRCMLHPTIPRTWKQPTDAWFPGMRTKMLEAAAAVGVENRKVEQKEYYKSKKFHYDEEAVEEARSKPIVRCASKYIDPDRLARQQQIEKDELILNKKVLYQGDKTREKVVSVPFYTLFPNTASPPNFEYANKGEDYRPVSAHKFREKKRDNWVSPRDFTVF